MSIQDLFVPFKDELQLRPTLRLPEPPLIEWYAAFGDFFFRLKGADPQLLWCDLGYTITPKRPLPPARSATLYKRVSHAFNGPTFFRVVPFPDGDDWLLIRPKRAVVKSPHQPAGAFWKWNCSFQSNFRHFDWLSQPQSYFENYLGNFESDLPLQMTRDCAALNEEERKWTLSASPDAVLWETLIRALFILASPLSMSSIAWGMSEPKECQGPLLPFYYPQRMARSLFPKSAEVLLQLLQTSIRLPFWRSLDTRGERVRPLFPFYQFDVLTHHERLDAAHLWRDFGRKIGKSAEVEAALRDLGFLAV